MKLAFWSWVDEDRISYLSKYTLSIVGSRLLLNILSRCGFGCIKYISDFVTPNDVAIDCTLQPFEANSYDIVSPQNEECCVISYLYPEDRNELKKLLRGSDLIVAHKYIEEVADVAEKLGVPYVPNFITTFLPDGVNFFEVEIPKIMYDPISYSINCSIQAAEVFKLLTGYDLPAIAPEAYVVDLRVEGYLKKMELRKK
ncbi:MAG: hypothetical protein QFX40_06895 [Archaeoglobales archaeon]|nr:hypothetical protein [Archaeoglobales archaeon]